MPGSLQRTAVFYVRLTVNGKSTFISSRLTFPLGLWDSAANIAAGKSVEVRNVNAELECIRAKLLHHYQRISDRGAYISAERVKSAYLGMGEEYGPRLDALDKFNRDFKQHVSMDWAQSTYRKYDHVRKRLAESLPDKLKGVDATTKTVARIGALFRDPNPARYEKQIGAFIDVIEGKNKDIKRLQREIAAIQSYVSGMRSYSPMQTRQGGSRRIPVHRKRRRPRVWFKRQRKEVSQKIG